MTRVRVGGSILFLVLVLHVGPRHRSSSSEFSFLDTSDSLRTDLSDYAYPTDAGRSLTSVFADYRRTHFHGGIDISTGRTTGYKVLASRSGYISRISVRPTGYGKSLWIKHADGYYTTYNHLSTFSDALEARVAAEQLALEQFPVLVEPSSGEFPVSKGDLIAYTGETGTGSPHLHFEIRDEEKNFVNPVLAPGISFDDTRAPQFRRIAITPLGEDSFIDAHYAARTMSVGSAVGASTHLPDTAHAFGMFGFAVDVRDQNDGSRFRSRAYSHHLFLDDSLIYSVTLDRAPSQESHQIRLHYDFDLMADEDGRFERLYKNSPNRLRFYKPPSPRAGVIDTRKYRDGVHRYRIVSRDFKGNTADISGTIVFEKPLQIRFTVEDSRLIFDPETFCAHRLPRVFSRSLRSTSKRNPWNEIRPEAHGNILAIGKAGRGNNILKIVGRSEWGTPSFPQFVIGSKSNLPAASVRLTHETEAEFVRVILQTRGVFTAEPSIVLLERNVPTQLRPIRIDESTFLATFRPQESVLGSRTVLAECEVNSHTQSLTDRFDIYHVSPTTPSRFSVDNGNLVIEANAASVFRPTFIEVVTHAGSGDSQLHFSLLPRNTVLDRGLAVHLKVTDATNAGFYYRDRERGGWSLASRRVRDGYFVDTLERWLGDVSLKQDHSPPTASHISTPTRWSKLPHTISFRYRDNLSGVEYKELKLYIDDVFVVPEIDGEHRRVVSKLPVPLTRGMHSVRILLRDRVGNSNEIRKTFRVR